MKISIIGGGSWGTTLADTLIYNGHDVLIYEINASNALKISEGIHPYFNVALNQKINVTNDLQKAINFSDYLVLAVPTTVMRHLLNEIALFLNNKKYFINVSKGIEIKTSKTVGQIVEEVINKKLNGGYCVLTGPSHAEETISRKLTMLVSASNDHNLSKAVQVLFSNDTYLRVYTSEDVIGCEVAGAVKNAIAVVSGMATGIDLGENARAALITRGIVEMATVVALYNGNARTVYGLAGVGDLIVTASSENSRNFRCGKNLGLGKKLDQIFNEEKMTIEGIKTIEALNLISVNEKIELPLINTIFDVIFNNLAPKEAVIKLLSRSLKSEDV